MRQEKIIFASPPNSLQPFNENNMKCENRLDGKLIKNDKKRSGLLIQ
jgi:hypothetical protein